MFTLKRKQPFISIFHNLLRGSLSTHTFTRERLLVAVCLPCLPPAHELVREGGGLEAKITRREQELLWASETAASPRATGSLLLETAEILLGFTAETMSRFILTQS